MCSDLSMRFNLVEVGALYLISIEHRDFIWDENMLLATVWWQGAALISDYIIWQYILIVPHENCWKWPSVALRHILWCMNQFLFLSLQSTKWLQQNQFNFSAQQTVTHLPAYSIQVLLLWLESSILSCMTCYVQFILFHESFLVRSINCEPLQCIIVCSTLSLLSVITKCSHQHSVLRHTYSAFFL
jgi:hypothetical protein